MRRIPAASFSLVLLTLPVCAQGATKLAGKQRDDATALAALLKQMGDSDFKFKGTAVAVGKKLDKALNDGRVFKKPGLGASGATGRQSGVRRMITILNAKLPDFQPGVSKPIGNKCSIDAIRLLDTFMHEGVHHCQVSSRIPCDPAVEGDCLLTEMLWAMAEECSAYTVEEEFKLFLKDILLDLIRGKQNGIPQWALDAWKGCSREQLEKLEAALSEDLKTVQSALEQIHGWTEEDCTPKDKKDLLRDFDALLTATKKPKTIEGLLDFLLEHDPFGSGLDVRVHRVAGDEGDPATLTWGRTPGGIVVNGHAVTVGIEVPQAVVAAEDSQGRTWFVVAGQETLGGRSRVRSARIKVAPLRIEVEETRDIRDPDDALGHLTGLARTDSGDWFALTRPSRTVIKLDDQDQDGLPDAVGLPAAQLPRTEDAQAFVLLEPAGDRLVVRQRAGGLVSWDLPWLELVDADGDDFFEGQFASSPTTWSDRPPVLVADPVQGATRLAVAGRHGNTLLVLAGQGQALQPLAQGQMPATEDDTLILKLARPLQLGESVVVRDLQNGQESPAETVVARNPVVYLATPIHVPEHAEVEVVLEGEGFELAAYVFVDGRPASVLSNQDGRLVIRTPKLKAPKLSEGIGWRIEFQRSDGLRTEAEVALMPQAASK